MGTQIGDALKEAMRRSKEKQKLAEGDESKNTTTVTNSKPAAQAKESVTRHYEQQPIAALVSDPPYRLHWAGQFEPNPLFAETRERRFVVMTQSHAGIESSLLGSRYPENEADICLGLDFGTSSVKAVIRDATLGQSYAVPFSKELQDRFLLPTQVFVQHGVFSLQADGVRIEDLKLALMQPGNYVHPERMEEACALLALAIRHSRGWFLSAYAPRYRGHLLNWCVNVGLPARCYEDIELVERFRRIAWSAANLASDSGARLITRENVRRWLDRSTGRKSNAPAEAEVPVADVMVVPEIGAQIAGLVESTRWDVLHRPYFVFMDIGAGTLDCAFFAVLNGSRERQKRFVFYASDVQPLGVINLHRARTNWLKDALMAERLRQKEALDYVDRISKVACRYREFPEDVRLYMKGARLETLSTEGTVDDKFLFRHVLAQVCACMGQGKSTQKLPSASLQNIPVIVSGGGSRMSFYGRLPGLINEAWKKKWNGAFTVQDQKMVLPQGLEADGLALGDHDRLSVAYGLSLPSIGTIVRTLEIPPLPDPPDWSPKYSPVSKDHV